MSHPNQSTATQLFKVHPQWQLYFYSTSSKSATPTATQTTTYLTQLACTTVQLQQCKSWRKYNLMVWFWFYTQDKCNSAGSKNSSGNCKSIPPKNIGCPRKKLPLRGASFLYKTASRIRTSLLQKHSNLIQE